jgi:hypothetical protein
MMPEEGNDDRLKRNATGLWSHFHRHISSRTTFDLEKALFFPWPYRNPSMLHLLLWSFWSRTFSVFLVPFSRTCGPWAVCCMRCARYSWPSPRTTLSTSSSPSAAAATGNHFYLICSVADSGCLSHIRIFSIPNPGSKRFLIPDPHKRI